MKIMKTLEIDLADEEDEILQNIPKKYEPEEVFGYEELANWADRFGFVLEDRSEMEYDKKEW